MNIFKKTILAKYYWILLFTKNLPPWFNMVYPIPVNGQKPTIFKINIKNTIYWLNITFH